jgi:hypothetical protein
MNGYLALCALVFLLLSLVVSVTTVLTAAWYKKQSGECIYTHRFAICYATCLQASGDSSEWTVALI